MTCGDFFSGKKAAAERNTAGSFRAFSKRHANDSGVRGPTFTLSPSERPASRSRLPDSIRRYSLSKKSFLVLLNLGQGPLCLVLQHSIPHLVVSLVFVFGFLCIGWCYADFLWMRSWTKSIWVSCCADFFYMRSWIKLIWVKEAQISGPRAEKSPAEN